MDNVDNSEQLWLNQPSVLNKHIFNNRRQGLRKLLTTFTLIMLARVCTPTEANVLTLTFNTLVRRGAGSNYFSPSRDFSLFSSIPLQTNLSSLFS